MLVSTIMTRSVVTTEPTRSAGSARRLMREGRFRHVPVVLRDRLVGIVSDRDLAAAAEHSLIQDSMHTDVVCVTPDTPVEVAARLMVDNKVGALPVVDNGTDALVGIVSQCDLVDVLARLLGGDGPSTRLELCLTDVPRQLATVAAVAHARHIPINSLITLPATPRDRNHTVVLRVGTIAAVPFVTALTDAGIDVDA